MKEELGRGSEWSGVEWGEEWSGVGGMGRGNGRGGNKIDGIRTVENLILTHAVWVPVTAEADYDEAVLFGHLHSRLV